MKILIVGAGAIGQVYGWHLNQAGHNVCFFIKEKYKPTIADGFVIFRHGLKSIKRSHWRDIKVVTSIEQVQSTQWDQVYLTMSTDALHSDLTANILSNVGDATVVALQAGIKDGDYVKSKAPSARQVVQGMITLISYQSPFAGQQGESGVTYFIPPLAKAMHGGEQLRCKQVVEVLNGAGLPSFIVKDYAKASAPATALMQPIIGALQLNNWNLNTFTDSQHYQLGLNAAKQAVGAVGCEVGVSVGVFRLVTTRHVFRAVIFFARRFIPFDLQSFLAAHYGNKTQIQNLIYLDAFIELGQKHQQPTAALQKLVQLIRNT